MSTPFVKENFKIESTQSDSRSSEQNSRHNDQPHNTTFHKTTEKKIVTNNSFTYFKQQTQLSYVSNTTTNQQPNINQQSHINNEKNTSSNTQRLTDLSDQLFNNTSKTQLFVTEDLAHTEKKSEKKLSDIENVVAVVEKVNDDVYNVYFKNPANEKLYKYGYARIKTLRESKKIRKIFDDVDTHKCLMNCKCEHGEVIPSDFISVIDDLNKSNIECNEFEL